VLGNSWREATSIKAGKSRDAPQSRSSLRRHCCGHETLRTPVPCRSFRPLAGYTPSAPARARAPTAHAGHLQRHQVVEVVGLKEHGAVPRIQQRQHDVHKRLVGTCMGARRHPAARPCAPRSPRAAGMQHPGPHAGRRVKRSGAHAVVMGRAALGAHARRPASARTGPRAMFADQHPAAAGQASTSASARGRPALTLTLPYNQHAAWAGAPAVTMASCPGSPFSAASLACSAATCARSAGRVRRGPARRCGSHGAWQSGALPRAADATEGNMGITGSVFAPAS